MTTRFILIRHGQTEWNRGAERFRGRADVPLNDLGRAQAQKIAARLANEKIVAIYASPMQRTRCTCRFSRIPTCSILTWARSKG